MRFYTDAVAVARLHLDTPCVSYIVDGRRPAQRVVIKTAISRRRRV